MVREDRYLGYLVESLLSIYIMHHADMLKVALYRYEILLFC